MWGVWVMIDAFITICEGGRGVPAVVGCWGV